MKSIQALLLLAVAATAWCDRAQADGGQVRVMEGRGGYRLTVFTSPNPLRAGPTDVSVLLQDADTGEAVSDATVTVELTPADGQPAPLRALATTDAATNKLLRAALVELPSPGRWDVCVECTTAPGRPPIAATFSMDVAPPLPEWLTVWPWFAWPAIAVALFVVHRRLVHRNQSRHASGSRSAPQKMQTNMQFVP